MQKVVSQVDVFWLMSATFHNTKIIFENLIGKKEKEDLQRKHRQFGHFHWVQLSLGKRIVQRGMREAERDMVITTENKMNDEVDENLEPEGPPLTPAKRTRDGRNIPHFRPQFKSSPLRTPFQEISCSPKEEHLFVKGFARTHCKNCLNHSKRIAIPDRKEKVAVDITTGVRVPRVTTGCSVCKVNLCRKCVHNGGWMHGHVL